VTLYLIPGSVPAGNLRTAVPKKKVMEIAGMFMLLSAGTNPT